MTAASAVVVDASVAIAVMAAGPRHAPARRLLDDPAVRRIAPDLLALEAANAFWRRVRQRVWTAAQHDVALEALYASPIELTASGPLIRHAAQLSVHLDHPVYDCVYVALAQRERATLATLDGRMAKLAAMARVGLWSPA